MCFREEVCLSVLAVRLGGTEVKKKNRTKQNKNPFSVLIVGEGRENRSPDGLVESVIFGFKIRD